MKHLNPDFTARANVHDYHVGVMMGDDTSTITTVRVFALNRNQATRIAESAGYTVRDVNMVG